MSDTEKIKARLDITTLVGSYLKLQKAGINLKAPCPFHNEKTPSFFVSPARDSWHCFGCGKGGDIFAFVMELEGMTFPETLQLLAERAGIELTGKRNTEDTSKKSRLLDLTERACIFYQKQLISNKDALAYLKKRGVTSDTMKVFRLGFAPDEWRLLKDYLVREGFTEAEIQEAGLSIDGSRGAFDRFRSRIMFPFEDASGRVVGFTGRIFVSPAETSVKDRGDASKDAPKYMNSPQTPLYDKSRFLYGLHHAKQSIRENNVVVLVEGNMDMLMSYQAGVENVVAVSGTALTEQHLVTIRRLAEKVTIAFDTDDAGVAAARRAVEMAYAQEFFNKTRTN